MNFSWTKLKPVKQPSSKAKYIWKNIAAVCIDCVSMIKFSTDSGNLGKSKKDKCGQGITVVCT